MQGLSASAWVGRVNDDAAEAEFRELLATRSTNSVVIDSYSVDVGLLARLKDTGFAIVLFDDFRSLDSYPCDVLLNFTVDAPNLGYPNGPLLLLGPEYLAVGRKLVDERQESISRERAGSINNLLVAIGGSDPNGIAARVIGILHRHHRSLCLRALAPNDPELAAMLADFAVGSGILPRQPNLSEQFLWADAAITGGGLIKYESAFMAVPAAAIAQNEGQAGESKAFERAGLVFDLGLADEVSDEDLARSLGRFLFDQAARDTMTVNMRAAFPPDPTTHAAQAILQALRC